MLTLAVVAALEGVYASSGNTFYGFGNMVVSDAMGIWLRCFATIAVMVTLVYLRPYAADRDMLRGGEMFTLSMFALLGMFVMISGNNFLVIYLGLELLTLSSYALSGLAPRQCDRDRSGHEVFRAGWHGQRFLALRPVHALWRHRFFGYRASIQGRAFGSGQAPGAGIWFGVCRGWLGLQTGCGSLPHVDS